MASSGIPEPHGGRLINRVVGGNTSERITSDRDILRVGISDDLASDVENIADGVFSPLEGFMDHDDLMHVLKDGRLHNGLAWTIPILLDVDSDTGARMKDARDVLLVSKSTVALMHVEDCYRYDKLEIARSVYQTTDPSHPGVARTMAMKDIFVHGRIDLVSRANRDELRRYRLTPAESRRMIVERGWRSVVGFQTRNIPHLAHEMLQKSVLNFFDALFINPLIGRKKSGDFRDEVIIRAYEVLVDNYYPKDRVLFATLHTEMRYAGPKEAIHHAIMRKNLGCTHFIVGRDHAGVGSFYHPFAAQEIFKYYPDIGIEPVFFPAFFYCKRCMGIVSERMCPHPQDYRMELSGTRLRKMITEGERPSELLMRPEVVDVIMQHGDPFVP
ncbi:MAG: sulfate adenylyltransferase [Candidatus Nitrosocaldus sp.]|nr:sulfate adenylyltransferase [Candidatus Nitrosocaldus sp.]MDW7999774.1 sulfate adenylyltransferase [Candidatus Nitrosocaldus sp.]